MKFLHSVAATPLFRPKEEDWQLVPDHVGHMHLVDINAVDMDAEPLFDPATQTIFHLFTRQNPTTPQNIILHNEGQLTGSNFVASRQSRFHCHGRTKRKQPQNPVVFTEFCGLFIIIRLGSGRSKCWSAYQKRFSPNHRCQRVHCKLGKFRIENAQFSVNCIKII